VTTKWQSGGSFGQRNFLLKTNLQIFRTYEAEAICFWAQKIEPCITYMRGVYVLHVCIVVVVVVGKSNKKDDRIIMRSRDVFKHCGFIFFSNWCWLSEAQLNHRIF